jgi:hypothetical protein
MNQCRVEVFPFLYNKELLDLGIFANDCKNDFTLLAKDLSQKNEYIRTKVSFELKNILRKTNNKIRTGTSTVFSLL